MGRVHFYSAREEQDVRPPALRKTPAKRVTNASLAEQVAALSAQVAVLSARQETAPREVPPLPKTRPGFICHSCDRARTFGGHRLPNAPSLSRTANPGTAFSCKGDAVGGHPSKDPYRSQQWPCPSSARRTSGPPSSPQGPYRVSLESTVGRFDHSCGTSHSRERPLRVRSEFMGLLRVPQKAQSEGRSSNKIWQHASPSFSSWCSSKCSRNYTRPACCPRTRRSCRQKEPPC